MAKFPGTQILCDEKPVIIGQVVAESPSSIYSSIKGNCSIGYFSYIGKGSELYNTHIGRFCSIAPCVIIGPTNHPTENLSTHLFTFSRSGPFKDSKEYQDWCRPALRNPSAEKTETNTYIGNDVWIGRGVIIKRGLRIGDGAVIGAGAIVTKDVPPYSIVTGCPAVVRRMRFDAAAIERLIQLDWSKYDLRKSVVADLDFSDVYGSLERLEALQTKGELEILKCKKYKIDKREIVRVE